MFVEVAGKYNVMVAVLLLFNKFEEIGAKVVARFCVWTFLSDEGGLLLMVSGSTSAICRFFTHLICSNEHGRFALGAFRMHV
jgi:hypothetical protein